MTRPGGAALNSGQVFGKRVAVAIKRSRLNRPKFKPSDDAISSALSASLKEADSFVVMKRIKINAVKTEIQARMSENAGIICTAKAVNDALEEAKALHATVADKGLTVSSPAQVAQGFRWRQMAAASEAVLTVLDYYIANGGGSRGARAICSDEGTQCPEGLNIDLSRFRFIEEQEKINPRSCCKFQGR